jgi:1-acyl-sn-glycerol-3-phosphate acyltransferase
MNHPAWWDAIIPFALQQIWMKTENYAAIDAEAVQKYPVMAKVGFVPIAKNTLRGAGEFLRTGTAILAHDSTSLWVTAQGEFADPRVRPLQLRSGVGHLAARMTHGYILPLAVEYPFWNESAPEALLHFGTPIAISEYPKERPAAWTARIEAALTQAMDQLAAEAMTRDPTRFRTLLRGRTGVGGAYDWFRRGRAWILGQRFDPAHGDSE